jgi:hypothetical protein
MCYESGPPKQKIGAMCMCDDAARLNTENLFNYILHQLLNKLYHIIQILSIFL